MKEEIIVITNNSNKLKLLREIALNKLLINVKFYSFKELKKKLFFDYDNKTLEYIIKNYNVSLNVAKIYIDNLYFLKDLDDEKIKFLNKLKSELEDNNLLIKDEAFKKYINNKKIIVYGTLILSKEEELILNMTHSQVEFKRDSDKMYIPKVYEAKTMDAEVEFVANKISELLSDGIAIDKIKIIISEDYKNTIRRVFEIYNIPINLKFNNPFYSTFVAQEFLDNYDKCSIEENIYNLSEKYTNVNDLITIVNKSVMVSDKKIRKEFIINDLKQSRIEDKTYSKGIMCASLEDAFNDDEYVFLLGFNINYYPKINKDDDYLSDKLKEKLGIDTSISQNIKNTEIIKKQIMKIKNLIITYKLKDSKGIFYPSIFIKELKLEVKPATLKQNISYSRLNTKLHYAKDLDSFYKFNMISEELAMYKHNITIPYLEYDNRFKGINNTKLKERINNELVLAYTSLEMYNECAFKYYVSKILKIDNFENTFKTIIGNVTHHILEIGLVDDIDITLEIMKFIKEKEYVLSKREFFYLEKLALELKEVLKVIKEQVSHSKLNNYLFESDLYVYKDKDDVLVTFKGQFDKVMYNDDNGKKVIAVVDYKTGDIIVSLDNLKYGLNMQLPIYLYLLKKSDSFKDAEIAGFYIQKVIDKIPVIDNKKSINDIRCENMRLQGFTNSNTSIIEMIDDNYLEGKILKNVKYKKDGTLDSRSKILSRDYMEEITNIVEEKIDLCVDNIVKGDFSINPKVIKDKNKACEFCTFKDICFMSKKDEVVLGGEEDEMDGGTE